jgi:outer membrane protein assembly factor BamB
MPRLLCFALSCFLALAGPAIAEDWPHWRGPARNGIVAESSGYDGGEWPGEELWSTGVGVGGTSPLVVEGRLYALGHDGGEDRVVCLDAATGEELWRQTYSAPQYGRHSTGDEGVYAGPSSTPEFDTDSGLLYTLGIDGELRCWDTRREGRSVWRLNLYDEYAAPQRPKVGRSGLRDYGYTTAPLLHGDWLIVEVGAESGTLMAFDKRTGRRVWASAATYPAGHTGGMAPMTVAGAPCVAVLAFSHLLVARLDAGHEGETVAEYPWETEFANNIASPAVEGAHVVITSSYNHDAICKLQITLDGATPVWEQPFSSSICTPVIHAGHVYWSWRSLRCLDNATGEQRWETDGFGDAGSCIVTGDERLILWAHNGTLVLAETAGRSGGEYRELARRENLAGTDVWPHVVLSGGRLYLKDRLGGLRCYRTGR